MIGAVVFSPDGKRIVTGCDDQTAKVWDAGSGRDLVTLTGHSSGILSVAFSPDGRRIVTGSYDKTAKVWDAPAVGKILTLTGTQLDLVRGLFPGRAADCHRQRG